MAMQDISRFLLQPDKHYSSVHLQQGRVIVDSDWNERANIAAEELRSTVLDIVCSRGTPNEGMLISSAAMPASYDFDVAVGSYYLGGLRFAVETAESFLAQSDWLQVDTLGVGMPAVVPIDGTDRIDLVYMIGWEQPVTAVEDSELLEVALGGRDTSTRVKRMRRFAVKTDVGSTDCATAFGALKTELEAAGGELNLETGELESLGRMRVSFDVDPPEQDLCAEPTNSGYVGAQNQALRVELRGADKLVWGFDNAAHLYRVQVDDVDATKLTFLTEPPDLAAMPRKGQVVEVLQWGALLPNKEKVAEQQGVLTKVATTYDPKSKTLFLDSGVDTDWTTWLNTHGGYHNTKDPEKERQYLYLRVWDRGADTTSAAELDYKDLGTSITVPLGDTGLSVTVTADGMPGDHWIIAARPSTPDVVTPWDLGGGTEVPPHGPRRFYTALATISWVTDNPNPVTVSFGDCRTKLRPLCERSGCCTVTVGDGEQSFGQVNSLQDAIAIVPDGGKICVLPGVHQGTALLLGRQDIIIEGCGMRSQLENVIPSEGSTDYKAFNTPVLRIENSSNIVIKDLAIEGYSAVGVELVPGEGVCEQVQLQGLKIRSVGATAVSRPPGEADVYELPAPGIVVAGAREVDIEGCEVSSMDLFNFSFGVVLGGEHLRMRDCVVQAQTSDGTLSGALWGVNVRSASRDVEIMNCTIDGGWGHGIALGHGEYFDIAGDPVPRGVVWSTLPYAGQSQANEGSSPDDCDCEGGLNLKAPTFDPPAEKIFLPAGPVEDVRIYDNEIRNHGLSGVSTTLFWPHGHPYTEQGNTAARFIVVTDIDIARNLIEKNLQVELPAQGFVNYDVAVGGVVLAASVNAWIHDNQIRSNGERQVEMPMCGVGLVAAMNAVVEDNQIRGTGLEASAGRMYISGLRGGIAVGEATGVRTRANSSGGEMPTFEVTVSGVTPPEPVKDWTGTSNGSAVIVRGNEVSQPLGRALWVRRAFGAVTVTGNTLESFGSPVFDGPANVEFGWKYGFAGVGDSGGVRRQAAGACVEINDFGLNLEEDWTAPPPSTVFPAVEMVDPGATQILGGAVLMSANTTKLEWTWAGGWATAILLSSLDSTAMTGNSCQAKMGGTFSPKLETTSAMEFLIAMAANVDGNSLLISHAYVGGRGGAVMSGNRFGEGRYDALFSGVSGTAMVAESHSLVESVEANCLASNLGSHCFASKPGDAATAFGSNAAVNDPGAGSGFACGSYLAETVAEGASGQYVGVTLYVPVP